MHQPTHPKGNGILITFLVGAFPLTLNPERIVSGLITMVCGALSLLLAAWLLYRLELWLQARRNMRVHWNQAGIDFAQNVPEHIQCLAQGVRHKLHEQGIDHRLYVEYLDTDPFLVLINHAPKGFLKTYHLAAWDESCLVDA